MPDFCKRRLSRKAAIFLAVFVMWLLGSIGLYAMHATHHWSFILLDGYDTGTLGQIGGYYLARVGALTPSLGLGGLIIGLSEFRRPVRAACLTALAYHGILTAIRLALNRFWSAAPALNQSIPVLAELAQLVSVVVFMGFYAWFLPRVINWVEAIRALRHFRQTLKPK